MFAEYAQILLQRCRAKAPSHGFRFKNNLFSVDATTISLCLSTFDWAYFRKAKGGIKVHVQLDHRGNLPSILNITPAREQYSPYDEELKTDMEKKFIDEWKENGNVEYLTP